MGATLIGADDRSAARVERAERAGFRRDIEGLRGVAVLLVILYHSHVPGMTGGFVGVDVFFVISGFVITGTLHREMAESATIRVGRFLMRRVRRLLPALALMVAATLAAGALILSPLEWKNLARDSASAVLYVSNMVFARSRGGYFGGADSPLLHTWSLSVEEQFYLGWPLLFLIAVKVSRSRADLRRRLIVVLTTAATASSFAFSFLLSQRGTPWAYLSAPTRAWE